MNLGEKGAQECERNTTLNVILRVNNVAPFKSSLAHNILSIVRSHGRGEGHTGRATRQAGTGVVGLGVTSNNRYWVK